MQRDVFIECTCCAWMVLYKQLCKTLILMWKHVKCAQIQWKGSLGLFVSSSLPSSFPTVFQKPRNGSPVQTRAQCAAAPTTCFDAWIVETPASGKTKKKKNSRTRRDFLAISLCSRGPRVLPVLPHVSTREWERARERKKQTAVVSPAVVARAALAQRLAANG